MNGTTSSKRFLAPARLAGYARHDPSGPEIGEIEQLFVDGRGGPESVAVKIASGRRGAA